MKKSSPRIAHRNVFVCARKGCSRCECNVDSVPPKCPFSILHVLETRDSGIKAMPRQSGKTRRIVSMANELAAAGGRVCIVTFSSSMCDTIRSRYRLDPSVRVISESFLWGLPEGYVLFDDVLPDRVRELSLQMRRSKMVAAYYTPKT